jgi:Uma2 family endonuclease
MTTAQKKSSDHISEEDYLAGELASEIKHEYVGGQVYAMTGGTPNHVKISGNLHAQLWNFLRGKSCDVYQSDMKVKSSEEKYRYPDVLVTCSEIEGSYTDSPVIIVEVLSSSTRRVDGTIKRLEYLNIPTLKEYLLIEQDFVDVEVCRKENGWKSDHYFLGDEVHLASVGFTISVEEIYERVQNEDMVEFLKVKEEESRQ